jgi:ABC-type transport system involved in multi-copper enzyme maturation permease subunit
MAVLAMNALLMSGALFLILAWRGESPWPLVPAILLIVVELAVITAFALFFSSLTNPILAALWTFAAYVTGHLSWSLRLLKEKLPEGPGQLLCDVVYWLLPNLQRLNLKAEVVHGVELPSGYLLTALVYGLAYTAIILGLACVAFERKEFN